jgi:hypothetical protein
MIETPADYRSFVFCKANKTPVCSLRSGVRSFVFVKANKTQVCSLAQFDFQSRVRSLYPTKSQKRAIILFFILGLTRKSSGYTLQSFAPLRFTKGFLLHPSLTKEERTDEVILHANPSKPLTLVQI